MITMAFVETPKGSDIAFKYDEDTLEFISKHKRPVSLPFAYGFIPETLAEDGDCADCFIVTTADLKPGQTYKTRIKNIIEFWEDDEEDHKLVLTLADKNDVSDWNEDLSGKYYDAIQTYLSDVFSDQPDKTVKVGDVLGQDRAIAYLNTSRIDYSNS